jgi:hypothetical protein
MRTRCGTVLGLTIVAVTMLAVQGCASTSATNQGRASSASKDQAGQAALDGMENSVIKDRNSDSTLLVKPPQ